MEFQDLVNYTVYLYEECKIHDNCFQLKHNDETFLNEIKFFMKDVSYCSTDLFEEVNQIFKKIKMEF